MATLEHLLLDTASNLYVPELALSRAAVETDCPYLWSVTKLRLHGGLQDGVDLVQVENGRLGFTVVPTRGMALLDAECDGVRLGWDSPVPEPVHPKFINIERRGNLGWLDGFNEWLARCGLENTGVPGIDTVPDNQGNPQRLSLPLHGRIGNLPASRLAVSILKEKPWTIRVTGEVYECSMFGAAFRLKTVYETEPGATTLRMRDEVTNLRGVPSEFQVLYHVNYGAPLLEAGARLVLPVRELSPRDPRAAEGLAEYARLPGPTAGFVEQCYFFRLGADRRGRTAVMLRGPAGDRGATLRWSLKDLPAFTVWKNTGATGDGYVVGLEPGTSYPNPRPFEREHGRVSKLAPGATRAFALELGFLPTKAAVTRATREIAALARGKPTVHAQAHPDFSPAAE